MKTTLSKNIASFRLECGMTQTELGQRIGVRQTEISMYESGKAKPPIPKLVLMCKVFECPMEKLVGVETHH